MSISYWYQEWLLSLGFETCLTRINVSPYVCVGLCVSLLPVSLERVLLKGVKRYINDGCCCKPQVLTTKK